MKKYRLKRWVAYTCIFAIMFGIIGLTIITTNLIITSINTNTDNNTYVLDDIADYYLPVNKEEEKIIGKPFESDSVNISVDFYDPSSDTSIQEKSLIKFNNIYMPSTGIIYNSENPFDVISIMDGEVIEVTKDEMFGNVVVIKHDNELISKYHSLNEVDVKVGDKVVTGDNIGTSGLNKVLSGDNYLYFELTYNGMSVNPNNYYDMNMKELKA